MEWIILAFNNWAHYVFQVLGQNGPLGTKKRTFWTQIEYVKKWIFLKITIFKFDEIAQKVVFGVNNELKKRWATSFIENFSGCQN